MNRSDLVGTRVGVIAQRLRERIELMKLAVGRPEALGTCSNDLIARQLVEALCLPGKAFVDVGAHIGSVIDGVTRNSRPSVIIAVEAIPVKAQALRRRFPSIVVHECAVGEEVGELPFFVDARRSGYSSLFPDTLSLNHQINVPVRRLDDLVGAEVVDVIKIDVEGAELSVLRGAVSLLHRDRPSILFESGPAEVGGLTKQAIWEWLDQAGYAVLVPNRVAHIDPGLSCEGFIEAHLYPRRTTNYFAIARSRRDELRARARLMQKLH